MQISYRIALIIIQLTAIIFAIYFWKNYKNSNQRYFLLFIIFSLIIDQANGIISIYLDQRISIFHNILVIVSGFFYLYWFNKILKKKTVTKSLLAVFSLFSIYTLATLNLKTDFFSDLLTVQIIFILICSLLYFIELIKINKVIDYYKSQKFWIVIGLLIFYIGYLPLYLFLDFIKTNTIEYKSAMLILNVILYGCYSYSFAVSKYKIDE